MTGEHILDIIGLLENTNKSSGGQGGAGVLTSYEHFFKHLRHERFSLLEIGVYQGASLRTWKAYFPNVNIIGLDLNPACKQHEEDRISIEIGSQDDPELLDKIVGRHKPLIVIDDGSHEAHHMISSFERIFPGLQDGGYYILEDAYMHYGVREKDHVGLAKTPLKDYFMKLATNKVSGSVQPEDDHGIGGYLFSHIEFVGYLNGVIIIRKSPAEPSKEELISLAEDLAAESTTARYWAGAAAVILKQGGRLDRAEALIRKAIEVDYSVADFHHRLADILERQGKLDDAIEVSRAALGLDTNWFPASRAIFWFRLGQLHTSKGDFGNAAKSFQEAVEFSPKNSHMHLCLSVALERIGKPGDAIEAARRAVETAPTAQAAAQASAHLSHLTEMRHRVVL